MKSRIVRTGIVVAKKVKKKIKNFVTANPKKSIVAAGVATTYGYGKTPMARKSQNQLIEMQNFNDGMGLLMNSLDMLGGSTYEQPAFTPIITCREFNNTTTCY